MSEVGTVTNEVEIGQAEAGKLTEAEWRSHVAAAEKAPGSNIENIDDELIQITSDKETGVIHGDSGGPLLITTSDGELAAAGIGSSGGCRKLLFESKHPCRAIYVSIPFYRTWIKDAIRELRSKYGHFETMGTE